MNKVLYKLAVLCSRPAALFPCIPTQLVHSVTPSSFFYLPLTGAVFYGLRPSCAIQKLRPTAGSCLIRSASQLVLSGWHFDLGCCA